MAPRGVAVYPKLNAADTKFKKEGEFSAKVRYDASREDVKAFITKLEPMHEKAVANAEVAFAALSVKARKALEAKGVKSAVVNPLYSEVYDEATEQPTGEIEFKFGTPASGEIKNGKYAGKVYIKRPTIVDAKGKVLVQGTEFGMLHEIKGGTLANTVFKKMGPEIWGGSEIKCSIEVGIGADGEPGYFIPGTGACGLSLRLRGVQLLKLVQGGSADLGFGEEDGYEGDGEQHDSAENDDTEADGAASDESDF
jgi:hypothetical protein